MEVSTRIELIGKHMVEILIEQLKNGEIALHRAQHAAHFYLEKIKTAGSHTELTQHVQTMLTELPEMHVAVRSDKIRMIKVEQKNSQQT